MGGYKAAGDYCLYLVAMAFSTDGGGEAGQEIDNNELVPHWCGA